MCIMEVRPGQHDSTIQQACTHNVGTVVSDLELFLPLLRARNVPENLRGKVEALHARLNSLYNEACDLYGDFVAYEIDHHHLVDYKVGSERNIAAEIAHADIHRARKFETR